MTTDPWMRLCEQLEDEVVALGYDPKALPPMTWLEARVVLALAVAAKENDGTVRGVYVTITSLPMYAKTLLAQVNLMRLDEARVGVKEARRRVASRRRKREQVAS